MPHLIEKAQRVLKAAWRVGQLLCISGFILGLTFLRMCQRISSALAGGPHCQASPALHPSEIAQFVSLFNTVAPVGLEPHGPPASASPVGITGMSRPCGSFSVL